MFLVEISSEMRQTCHFYRNRRWVLVLKVEYRYSKLFLAQRMLSTRTES